MKHSTFSYVLVCKVPLYLPIVTISDQLALICVLQVILTGHHSVAAGGGA